MNELPLTILSLGVAVFLMMVGAIGIIWALRCSPKLPHYRLPAIVALSVPTAASIIWALLKLS